MDKHAEWIEKLKEELEESEEWIDQNYTKLPDAVQTIISRGVVRTENRIEKLEELSKKNNPLLKQ